MRCSLEGTWLAFLGDVHIPHPVKGDCDLGAGVIFNLEGPITTRSEPVPGKIVLRMEAEHFAQSLPTRPLAVGLANNHIADYGSGGIVDTLRALEDLGIAWFGAGSLQEGCHNPLMIEADGIRAAVLAYCSTEIGARLVETHEPGPQVLQFERVEHDVSAARAAGADRVICCFHFGKGDVVQPRPSEVVLARQTAELGVDLVIGHHSHVIQPHEVYRGVPIFYGLGNCIFPSCDSAPDKSGAIYRLQQFRWNRESLAVHFDLRTAAFRTERLRFMGTHLERAGAVHLRPLQGDADRNTTYFDRSLRYATLRTSLASFLTHPRLPSLRAIRHVIGLVARGERN